MIRKTFMILFCNAVFVNFKVQAIGKYKELEFLEPCSRKDPNLENCLVQSFNELVEHFQTGLPLLGYSEVEPIILDEIQISLGEKSTDYRARFTNVTATGVSALRITTLRTSITDNEVQLQVSLHIPKINATAEYRSSGTLILVQASGAGDYWGEYDGVDAKVFIRAKPFMVENRKYLRLQQLKMDFGVKGIKMGVKTVQDSTGIIQAALNLFINSYSQELLKKMKPDLRRKLVQLMSNFVDKLFMRVPYDAWIVD